MSRSYQLSVSINTTGIAKDLRDAFSVGKPIEAAKIRELVNRAITVSHHTHTFQQVTSVRKNEERNHHLLTPSSPGVTADKASVTTQDAVSVVNYDSVSSKPESERNTFLNQQGNRRNIANAVDTNAVSVGLPLTAASLVPFFEFVQSLKHHTHFYASDSGTPGVLPMNPFFNTFAGRTPTPKQNQDITSDSFVNIVNALDAMANHSHIVSDYYSTACACNCNCNCTRGIL